VIPEEKLRQGDVAGALEGLQAHVRQDPSNSRHRVFLFQLLSVVGQWERALTQLDVVADLDAGSLPMVHTYREALRCEVLRAEIFQGKRSPLVFGEPEPWIAFLVQALRVDAEGDASAAADLRDQAFEAAPATAGSLDDTAFEWIADSDSRLGPILEAVIRGRYYWVPFLRIRAVEIDEPQDLRDSVWTPARITFSNGGNDVALIPTRYVGSEKATDEQLRLARRTEWVQIHGETYAGLGQRILCTDTGEHPLMEVRKIVLATHDPATGGAPAEGSSDEGPPSV